MKTDIENKQILPSKFILICFFVFLFSLNFLSAGFGYNSDSTILKLGNFQQGKSINLIQTCSNCTYNNITKIKLPDGTITDINAQMTKDGTFYNYTFSGDTSLIGEYQVNGVGDLNGNDSVWFYSFEIQGGNLGFFIIAFVLFYGLTLWGLKVKHEWIALMGCLGLCILGIYTSFNGIDIYKNDLTKIISYITLGVGLGVGFEALRELTYK